MAAFAEQIGRLILSLSSGVLSPDGEDVVVDADADFAGLEAGEGSADDKAFVILRYVQG